MVLYLWIITRTSKWYFRPEVQPAHTFEIHEDQVHMASVFAFKKSFLYSTANSIQYYTITYMEKESNKSRYMHVYNWINLLYMWN